VADEIYCDAIMPGIEKKHVIIAKILPEMEQRTIIINAAL
jgi:hypothetical protein